MSAPVETSEMCSFRPTQMPDPGSDPAPPAGRDTTVRCSLRKALAGCATDEQRSAVSISSTEPYFTSPGSRSGGRTLLCLRFSKPYGMETGSSQTTSSARASTRSSIAVLRNRPMRLMREDRTTTISSSRSATLMYRTRYEEPISLDSPATRRCSITLPRHTRHRF